jgi:hypothetical protein
MLLMVFGEDGQCCRWSLVKMVNAADGLWRRWSMLQMVIGEGE